MELILTPRLETVARLVPPGVRFADIGTDHAYLPAKLLLDGVIDRAIAADLREGPLSRARETARQYGVEDKVSFRLCDGLSGIECGETDAIAIAGMGGETIAAILAAAPWTKEHKMLLQPMTSFHDLRGWLQRSGYEICREHIAREGNRLYSVMEVRGGEMPPLTPAELWAGKQSDDPLRPAYLDLMTAKAVRVLNGLNAAQTRDEAQIARMEDVLSGLTAMRKEYP